MKSDKTIDEAIQEFKKYCELNGDFDELDFKEAIFDHALAVAERLIGEPEYRETLDMGLSSWSTDDLKAFGKNELKIELRTAFRKEYGESDE